ncbi:MAG: DUF4886 domain-containing protein [Clostridia bacterium]|nr:DUF4886 domain-containing protein [Clostridia bacterium]
MKILCIGNSFSQDATTYLRRVAAEQGIEIYAENLYIGGCSLEQHYNNLLSDAKAYELELDGKGTNQKVAIAESLEKEKWDVVTIQQASHFSAYYDTYQPFATEIVKFIRQKLPEAKVYVHQTWAYEDGSQRLAENGFATRKEMFAKLKESYCRLAGECAVDGVIPSGEVFERMAEKGMKCHRDTFHATYGAGRYALALTWIKALTANDISENTFTDTAEPVSAEDITKIKQSVNEVL